MARIESKSITCKPAQENSTIEKYQRFGWTLESSQEIYNKDSHVEGNFSVTETTNYVKLVFKRDKDMPYYNQIVALENKYDTVSLPNPGTHVFIKVITLIGAILFLVMGIPFAIAGLAGEGAGYAVLGILFVILGIGCIVVRSIFKKRDNEVVGSVRIQEENMRQQILREVQKYV